MYAFRIAEPELSALSADDVEPAPVRTSGALAGHNLGAGARNRALSGWLRGCGWPAGPDARVVAGRGCRPRPGLGSAGLPRLSTRRRRAPGGSRGRALARAGAARGVAGARGGARSSQRHSGASTAHTSGRHSASRARRSRRGLSARSAAGRVRRSPPRATVPCSVDDAASPGHRHMAARPRAVPRRPARWAWRPYVSVGRGAHRQWLAGAAGCVSRAVPARDRTARTPVAATAVSPPRRSRCSARCSKSSHCSRTWLATWIAVRPSLATSTPGAPSPLRRPRTGRPRAARLARPHIRKTRSRTSARTGLRAASGTTCRLRAGCGGPASRRA